MKDTPLDVLFQMYGMSEYMWVKYTPTDEDIGNHFKKISAEIKAAIDGLIKQGEAL